MGVLTKAALTDLEEAFATLDEVPSFDWVRPPETGLVMIQGRAGGTGQPFNLGETTVTRCVLRTQSGETGVGYVQGRNKRHAELAALFDALLQNPKQAVGLQADIVERLAALHQKRRAAASRKVKATQVDFFTMVRGEDPRP